MIKNKLDENDEKQLEEIFRETYNHLYAQSLQLGFEGTLRWPLEDKKVCISPIVKVGIIIILIYYSYSPGTRQTESKFCI